MQMQILACVGAFWKRKEEGKEKKREETVVQISQRAQAIASSN